MHNTTNHEARIPKRKAAKRSIETGHCEFSINSIWWLGYHLLGYKTNDSHNIPHLQTSYHSRHVTARTTLFWDLQNHLSN